MFDRTSDVCLLDKSEGSATFAIDLDDLVAVYERDALGGIAEDQQHDFIVNGLRKGGLVNEGYRGTTLRENLGLAVETLTPATV